MSEWTDEKNERRCNLIGCDRLAIKMGWNYDGVGSWVNNDGSYIIAREDWRPNELMVQGMQVADKLGFKWLTETNQDKVYRVRLTDKSTGKLLQQAAADSVVLALFDTLLHADLPLQFDAMGQNR